MSDQHLISINTLKSCLLQAKLVYYKSRPIYFVVIVTVLKPQASVSFHLTFNL